MMEFPEFRPQLLVGALAGLAALYAPASSDDGLSCMQDTELEVFEDPSGPEFSNFGYKNAAGAIVISGRYSVAQDFGKFGYAYAGGAYIDSQGKVILKPYIFDNGPDYFKEGVSRFVENNKIGFVDRCLNQVIPARFDFAGPFIDEFAVVCIECRRQLIPEGGEHYHFVGGKWGAIDHKGDLVFDMTHLDYETVRSLLGGDGK